MLRSFVSFVWAVYDAVFVHAPSNWLQAVFAHKTEEARVKELRWWPRCCNNDREASILVAPDLAAKKRGSATRTAGVGN